MAVARNVRGAAGDPTPSQARAGDSGEARRQSPVTRWTVVAWLALLVLSAGLHLFQLGERSYHHDEAIHAHGAWVLAREGRYSYDPTYHGPLLYLLVAGSMRLVGASDFVARLPVAVAGIGLLAVAFALRRRLGERAALWTGALATVSPTVLYYGRFLRMDVLELATASAAVVTAWQAADGRSRLWPWAGVWAGLALATKENAYVTMALVAAVGAVLVLAGRHPGDRLRAAAAWSAARAWGLLAAVAAASLVGVLLYTVGFTHPGDWAFPVKAVAYWWGQHEIQRIPGPWYFHLERLALYEWFPLATALVWAARRRARMAVAERALLLFGLASLAMYAYLGEKVPWLAVHQVWAFLPLAGLQLAHTFGPDGRWWGRTLASAGLVATTVAALAASFVSDEISPARRRVEALTYVQTCPELTAVAREGRRLAAAAPDELVAAVAGDASWPLTWYWRDVQVWWQAPAPGVRPPLVVVDVDQEAEVRRQLGPGYTAERVPLRAWWLFDGPRPSFGALLRYVLTRVPWGVVGSSDVVVLRRGEAPPPTAVPAAVPAALAAVLPGRSATIVGAGWLIEPRGVAVDAIGRLAVADPGASTVRVFAPDGSLIEVPDMPALAQPEGVAWVTDDLLAVADTWNHRAILLRLSDGVVRELPAPPDGWFGPRAVAVGPDGAIAVSDTGHKRIWVVRSAGGSGSGVVIGGAGAATGEFVEPGGLAWLDRRRLLVCDTGNHRLQVVSVAGPASVVPLAGAWDEFYARPQVAVLGDGLWLASDAPAGVLWLVRDGRPQRLALAADGIVPAGVAASGDRLAVADLTGRVWVLAVTAPTAE